MLVLNEYGDDVEAWTFSPWADAIPIHTAAAVAINTAIMAPNMHFQPNVLRLELWPATPPRMSMIAPAIITMVPRTITIPANHPQIVSSNPLIGLLKFGEGAKYTDPGKCADSNLVTNTIMLCLSVCLLDESPFYTMQNSCVYLDHCRMLICPVDTPEQLVLPTRTRSSPRAAP